MKTRKEKVVSEHATIKEKNVYLMFLLGQNIAFQVTLVILDLYWKETLGIQPLIVGTIVLVARIWDGINDPILGSIVQKVGKNRFGMYKPWTVISSFLLPILVFTLFATPFGPETTGTIIWAALSYIFFQMAYTLTDIPIFSLSITMEPDTKRRTTLLFFGRIGAGIAGIVTSLIFFGIRDAASDAIGALNAYLLAGGIAALLALVTMAPIFMVRERNIVVSESKLTFKDMFKFIANNKHLLKLLIGAFLSGLFNMMFMTSLPFLISEYVVNGNRTLIMTLSATFSLMITFGLMSFIQKFGARKTIFIFEILGVVLTVIGVLITYYSKNQLALLVMALGANMITSTPMTVRMGKLGQESIEYGSYITGKRQEAVGFASQTFNTKITMGLGTLVSNGIFKACGFHSQVGEQGKAIPQADGVIENMLWSTLGTLIACAIISIIVFGVWYNLRTNEVKVMADVNRNLISRSEGEKLLQKIIKENQANSWINKLKKIKK